MKKFEGNIAIEPWIYLGGGKVDPDTHRGQSAPPLDSARKQPAQSDSFQCISDDEVTGFDEESAGSGYVDSFGVIFHILAKAGIADVADIAATWFRLFLGPDVLPQPQVYGSGL